MTRFHADPDFEPRVADWLEDDPVSAPGAVLATVLAAFPLIPQRRASRVPRRFPAMSSFAKLAVAAVAVIAIGTVGIFALQPSGGPGVGAVQSPAPTPAPTATPSPTPSPTATPSPTPVPTAAPLSGTFTSPGGGISIAHPEGWRTQPATEPWVTGWPNFKEPFGDFLFDPVLQDHLFIALASQPLGDTPGNQWVADIVPSEEECGATEKVTIDGASGLVGADCNIAVVAVDGRGYAVMLYTSADEGWLDEAYDRAWFEQLLTTIELRPGDVASASPSP